MKSRRVINVTVLCFLICTVATLLIARIEAQSGATSSNTVNDAADGQIVTMDRTLFGSLAKGHGDALAKIADADLSWTDPLGHMRMGTDIQQALASGNLKPVLGDMKGLRPALHRYGLQIAVVQYHQDKNHAQHIWVMRSGRWRLLNVAEITEFAKVPYGGTTVNAICANPCQTVPFVPSNSAQQAVMASWQEQQTGPQGWLRRVADSNVAFSSNGTSTRADRISVMNQEKASHASVASAPLVWARIWDFQDGAIMLSIQQGNNSKAFWASRAFVKNNGYWQMTESFQTIIQESQAMSPLTAK